MAAFSQRSRNGQRWLLASLLVLVAATACSIATLAQNATADAEAAPQLAATESENARAPTLPSDRAGAAAEHAGVKPDGTSRGWRTFWRQSGGVARGTLLLLGLLFGSGAYIVLRRFDEQQLVLRGAKMLEHSFWTAPNMYEAVRTLDPQSTFRALAEGALEAARHREGRLTDGIERNDWIAMSAQRSAAAIDAQLQRGIVYLDAIGATAPFIGLFGTVWGIHRVLTEKDAGLSAPIGAALITTAAGLAVTVLAIVATSWLRKRNDRASAAVHDFANDVQAVLRCADAAIESEQVGGMRSGAFAARERR